ncbi:MAG: transposase [Neisseriaceae bacterium]|nr:transposase [Neisseriaceae bacterium]
MIEAQRARPNKDKKGNNTQDIDAAWHVKTASNGKKTSTYGFKIHIKVGEDGFIKATDFTAGNVHDSQIFTQLLDAKDRNYRNKPLSDVQKAQNRLWAGIGCTVERTFGILKQHDGTAKARYLGLKRNVIRVGLMCIAYNMERGLNLLRESVA